MISRQDIQRLIHRPPGERPVLSVFLDMSVTSTNKRTYEVFLNKKLAEHRELDSDREEHHREALGAAFGRVQRWLAEAFDESNKGVAIYTEIGGDWFDAVQFPVPVENRTEISREPVIGPLAEIVERYHHHGVILVDRQHLRMLSVYLGRPIHEHEVQTDPYPAPHDVQRGGYSAIDYQKRKAEEVRHFFKEFALEVAEFNRRYRPDDLILVGTDENVKAFMDFLEPHVREKVAHTAHGSVEWPNARILERLEPYFREQMEQEARDAVTVLRDRVRQDHLATAGFQNTLEQLQEGKVDTLVMGRNSRHMGAQCTRCGFYLEDSGPACPYCGGATRGGVDLAEAMIRMAEEQDVPIEFTHGTALADMNGVGALLKF